MALPALVTTNTYAYGGVGGNQLVGTEHVPYEAAGAGVKTTKIADPCTVNATIPRRIVVKTDGLFDGAVAPSPTIGTIGRGAHDRPRGRINTSKHGRTGHARG